VLWVDPKLPSSWGTVTVAFRCLKRRVRLRITDDYVDISVDAPLRVRLIHHETLQVTGEIRLIRYPECE
jgi:hypothetical protein